ncbi:ATP-binding protein [Planctomycetes bacterium K23_9]|uniref:histidine kinase n=1 Tax=Stieleria marina TaxID=1930275 RepID=A0A517NS31_9BACT|nr:Blue-light-activated protein [Planctomycetes bacterium K23_9]
MSKNDSQIEQSWSQSQVRALSFLLAAGGLVSIANPITLGGLSTPTRFWISITTGVCLLLLLGILQRTRALIPVLMMGTPVVFICFASGFVLTGDLYYLAIGMTLPIAVALFGGTRIASLVLAGYVLFLLGMSAATHMGVWVPPISADVYMAGLIPEAIVLALITVAITGSTIWKEQVVAQVRDAELSASGYAHAQQRRFEAICQSAYDGIIETDSQGTVVWAQGRLIGKLGFEPSDLVGKNALPLLSASARRKLLRELHRTENSETNFCVESKVDDKTGRVKWLRFSGGNLIDAHGNQRWVIAVQDIDDEMVNMERILERSRLESLGTVCGGLAHDFNNLLTVIGIYGELIDNEEVRNGILQSQRQASDLTASLLTFARKQEFRQQNIEINRFLETSRPMIERLVPANVDCHWTVQNRDTWVCVDPGQLQQVVINLVNNSIHAMPNGGQLSIELTLKDVDQQEAISHGVQSGPFVVLSVRDSGSGMSPETAAKSVEPFFTTKPREQGTGLGLATAHGTARHAGGWISVTSQIGQGTQVDVVLPRHRNEALKSSSHETETTVDTPIRQVPKRVLLIEDRETLRTAIDQTLTTAGHEVTALTTGEQGWECYREKLPFDLFITDIVLPGMSGIQWIRQVRKSSPDAKVILISGHQQDDISIVNERPDITWFLPKPFNASDLLAVMHQIQNGSANQWTVSSIMSKN